MSEQPTASTYKPDGVIDEKMTRVLGQSWRTSCLGLLALLVQIVPMLPVSPQLQHAAQQLAPLLLGGGLLLSKDARVSSLPKVGK